jgi:hypothetical protein
MNIQFQKVRILQRFFDTFSGEFFIKTAKDTAIMITGTDETETQNVFDPEEIVDLDQSNWIG